MDICGIHHVHLHVTLTSFYFARTTTEIVEAIKTSYVGTFINICQSFNNENNNKKPAIKHLNETPQKGYGRYIHVILLIFELNTAA